MTKLYDFEVTTITGEQKKLSDYKGQAVLIVNTASKCGFTNQYAELEELHQKYGSQGLAILGFPCNQFKQQEQGSDTDINSFCQLNFGVTFDMFSKIDVNGNNADPLYNWLKTEAKGILGSKGIKWNFTKFLINRDGDVVDRFPPTLSPKGMVKDIEKLL
ncbi:glutathione peroxidase [Moritella viscosa]|uniref:Glutathione peroxidase n=1 Tax=Moritella viscosa TaxID=80854 RepID=A0A090IHV8_9GAMM|nr:glutathione peroxidase [Moritella viscosa]CED59589.1 glutathione peroxidase [Moritella viscosa]SGY87028.1 Glutathione peroxidase [Moritella viscosa]SGY88751.1 Glutathione peroxidase [Moritella viscosa]SGY90829.1 Glutathione peroxidase [Moritella viscosa]SGY91252.1 Glutathione peroxidase [Moritella viscosa]